MAENESITLETLQQQREQILSSVYLSGRLPQRTPDSTENTVENWHISIGARGKWSLVTRETRAFIMPYRLLYRKRDTA